jgi:hypothetical protein
MFVRLVRWLRGDKAAWQRALKGVRATRDMAQQTAVTASLAGNKDLSKISIELGAQCAVFLVKFGAHDPLRPDNDGLPILASAITASSGDDQRKRSGIR